MVERTYNTPSGTICYWVGLRDGDLPTLVFLPGLTADHRLFDRQIQYFEDQYNVFVWDAPGHGASWPFRFDFSLMDKARWLDDLLKAESDSAIPLPKILGAPGL